MTTATRAIESFEVTYLLMTFSPMEPLSQTLHQTPITRDTDTLSGDNCEPFS